MRFLKGLTDAEAIQHDERKEAQPGLASIFFEINLFNPGLLPGFFVFQPRPQGESSMFLNLHYYLTVVFEDIYHEKFDPNVSRPN